MTRYLISFPSGAMDHIPAEEAKAVRVLLTTGRALHCQSVSRANSGANSPARNSAPATIVLSRVRGRADPGRSRARRCARAHRGGALPQRAVQDEELVLRQDDMRFAPTPPRPRAAHQRPDLRHDAPIDAGDPIHVAVARFAELRPRRFSQA